jgi:hypothetical protein
VARILNFRSRKESDEVHQTLKESDEVHQTLKEASWEKDKLLNVQASPLRSMTGSFVTILRRPMETGQSWAVSFLNFKPFWVTRNVNSRKCAATLKLRMLMLLGFVRSFNVSNGNFVRCDMSNAYSETISRLDVCPNLISNNRLRITIDLLHKYSTLLFSSGTLMQKFFMLPRMLGSHPSSAHLNSNGLAESALSSTPI